MINKIDIDKLGSPKGVNKDDVLVWYVHSEGEEQLAQKINEIIEVLNKTNDITKNGSKNMEF